MRAGALCSEEYLQIESVIGDWSNYLSFILTSFNPSLFQVYSRFTPVLL